MIVLIVLIIIIIMSMQGLLPDIGSQGSRQILDYILISDYVYYVYVQYFLLHFVPICTGCCC